jgi:hypothetical protein
MAEVNTVQEEKAERTFLHVSPIEALIVWEATRTGYYSEKPKDIYLEFFDSGHTDKLKNAHITNRPTEKRAKDLGLDYSTMYLMEADMCNKVHSQISANRAEGYGTELVMETNDRKITKLQMNKTRSFEF